MLKMAPRILCQTLGGDFRRCLNSLLHNEIACCISICVSALLLCLYVRVCDGKQRTGCICSSLNYMTRGATVNKRINNSTVSSIMWIEFFFFLDFCPVQPATIIWNLALFCLVFRELLCWWPSGPSPFVQLNWKE